MLDGCRSAREVAALRLLDPACGTGNFLVAAAGRITAHLVRLGVDPAEATALAASCCWGADIDGDALAICEAALPGARLRLGDALLADWDAEVFDVVVGNPPFLDRLRRDRSGTRERAAELAARFGDRARAYTDEAALFLLLAVGLARPDGGRVGFVQPLAVLSARDAGPVRAEVGALATIEHLEAHPGQVFDAQVRTCSVILRRSSERHGSERLGSRSQDGSETQGSGLQGSGPRAAIESSSSSWARRLAPSFGIPAPDLATSGRLADLVTATADFRDQYYGLRGAVHEAGPTSGAKPRLVTCGVIDPARCRWGETPVRVHRALFVAPVVDVERLSPALAAWTRRRLVPKVLVATQTRVLEAVIDRAGSLLPSVPVITVETARPAHVAAVLLAPPVSAIALTAHLGAARSPDAIKLRAADVLDLPLPADAGRWDRAAAEIDIAHDAATRHDAGAWRAALIAAGQAMSEAYGLGAADPVVDWWLSRLPPWR